MSLADDWTKELPEVIEAAAKQNGFTKLTVRHPSEILAMEFPKDDLLLENGYLVKGDSLAMCGAGGVGKSRLSMQLAIALVTGREFLGWKTRGKGTRWLILQTENSNRRLKFELSAMLSGLTEQEREAVDDGIVIHTLETAEDSFLSLKLPENEARISALAPYEADSNEVLVVASGKANNAEEFEPFGIRLDPETMTYTRDESVDLEAWKERIGVDTKTSTSRATISTVVEAVEASGLDGIEKCKIVAAIRKESGVSGTYAYRLIGRAEQKKAIVRRKDDKLYVVPRKG